MAKTTPKKKAAPAKRPAAKPVAKKAPVKAKPVAKKPIPAKKPVSKKPVAKAKPAAKPAPKTKPAPKSKPVVKAIAKPKAAPAPSAKTAAAPAKSPAAPAKTAAASTKRPVAVSHRPQAASVAVQPRAGAKSTPPSRPRSFGGELPTGVLMTEDQVRRASDSAYMNDNQLSFFQERLLQMRGEVLARELDVKERLHQREVFADPADRASAEEEHWLDLRLRERESLLLKKIDDALRRIRDREYGYCEKTGEAIGIARLLARPTATVCVDIKGQDERAESQYRDR